MINSSVIGQGEIARELEQILGVLGQGHVNSVAYDTAWLARIGDIYSGVGFDGALPWVRRHQHDDGSWGGDVLHYHDRFICTIASVIALHTQGRGIEDEDRVRAGIDFLWREHLRLRIDAHETIAFPVLAVSLIREARTLGLDVPLNPYCDLQTIDKKLALLQKNSNLWRNNTMSFSLEVLQTRFPESADFLETNGSVGTSPAATASLLMRSDASNPRALDYLRSVVHADGGIPNVSPIDTFEAAWGLNYLRSAGAISPHDPAIRRVLDELWSLWSPIKGLGFSSYYSVCDLDDTAVGYAVLRWGGYPVRTDIFAQFEEEDHFRCFANEVDYSISATLRLVDALKMDTRHPQHEVWMRKAVGTLQRCFNNGTLWYDKWHASPYYPLCISVHALRGVADNIVHSQLRWVASAQNEDGGWGYYENSTSEETAYALLSLFYGAAVGEKVDSNQIEAGIAYLTRHYGRELTPLWIGKCLYTPPYVVRSLIASAFHQYHVWIS